MTHSLNLSEQQALLGSKNVQGSHFESPYYSEVRMLDQPVASSEIDTTSSVGVFKSRSVVQQPDENPYSEGLPIWRAALLVVNSALGAGILNFPQAYAECGGIATALTIQMVGHYIGPFTWREDDLSARIILVPGSSKRDIFLAFSIHAKCCIWS